VCWRPKFSKFLTVFTIGLSWSRFFGGSSEFWGEGLNTRKPLPRVRHWWGLQNTYIWLELREECPESAQSCVLGCKQGRRETVGCSGQGSKLRSTASGCSLKFCSPEEYWRNFSRARTLLANNFGENSSLEKYCVY
jgi:hypothetical protein